jgi:hypothetical protein
MPADEWGNFIRDVAVVILVAARPLGGLRAPVSPGLVIDAIYREQLDLATVYEIPHGFNHAEVLVLVEPSSLGWENDHRFANMAVNLQLHVLAKARAPPFMVLNIHLNDSS